VSESDYARKHSLLCLRLAAECRDLAAIASTMEMRARVLRMAYIWEELADQAAVEIRPEKELGVWKACLPHCPAHVGRLGR
jgi:hypothetical protein